MGPRPPSPSTCLPLALAVALCSCGEFHTARFYADADAADAPDLQGDAPADSAPSCTHFTEVVIETTELPPASVHLPYVFQLRSPQQSTVEWRLLAGALPDGLALEAASGIISGLPAGIGSFSFTVEASPRSNLSCVKPGVATLSLAVTWLCQAGSDCALPALDLDAECAGGLCSYSPANCPDVAGERTRWQASPPLPAGPADPWTIEEHHKLTDAQKDPKKPFDYRLSLRRGKSLVQLDYSLPNRWPLPFAAGESLLASPGLDGLAPAAALLLADPAALRPAVLYDGPFVPALLAAACTHPVCQAAFLPLPLACPQSDDQCGTRIPCALAAVDADNAALALPGTQTPVTLSGIDMLLALGAAYGYTQLDPLACPLVLPAWTAFVLYPAHVCPVPRITSGAASTQLLGEAFAPTGSVYLSGNAVSPAGLDITDLSFNLEQPFPGLVALLPHTPPAAAGQPQVFSLPITACGDYRVTLAAIDAQDTHSCVSDLREIHALPEQTIDLRIELAWTDDQGSYPLDESLRLLLRFPYFADSWDDTRWVCSADNMYTVDWTLGIPGKEAEICECLPADFSLGRPEVQTVKLLNRSLKAPYLLAVRSLEADSTLHAMLRVFILGQLVFEETDHPLAPGDLWTPGSIDPATRTFIPTPD